VAVDGLDEPLLAVSPPGDLDRLFVVEQDGVIRLHRRGDPPGSHSVFLDISQSGPTPRVRRFGNEMGLVGLAFDPEFSTTGQFYVNYTEASGSCFLGPLCCTPSSGTTCHTVIARYEVQPGNPDAADPGSETRILRVQQPQANHNGGQLFFGGDGFLYAALGDGGGSGDDHGACGNGQDTESLLGKLLRLDVRGVDPAPAAPTCGDSGVRNYDVPSDNPLVGGANGDCQEVFAWGLRNPWRTDLDATTGDAYIADVGQDAVEEIDFVLAGELGGRNFGWRVMEGDAPFNESCDSASCDTYICPLTQYDHSQGCSITGGHVYRGCLMPGLSGTYFYGDYCSGFVRTLEVDRETQTIVSGSEADVTGELDPGGDLNGGLTSFGLDARGELLIVDRADAASSPASGRVLRVLPLFTDLAVSAPGAGSQFLLGSPSWTWENLEFSTGHPVSTYRVYRGIPNGSFSCIFTASENAWPGGDPDLPLPGELFAYLVTALNASDEETSPGDPADARTLLPDPCP
jgi:glucose/arabinose dehydrogenase